MSICKQYDMIPQKEVNFEGFANTAPNLGDQIPKKSIKRSVNRNF